MVGLVWDMFIWRRRPFSGPSSVVASGPTLLVHVSPHLLALRGLARVWAQGRGADWLMFSLGAYSSVLGHYGSSDGAFMSYLRYLISARLAFHSTHGAFGSRDSILRIGRVHHRNYTMSVVGCCGSGPVLPGAPVR